MSLKATAIGTASILSMVAVALAVLAVSSRNPAGAWAGLCITSLAALGAWIRVVLICNRMHAARQAHRLERKIDALRGEIATRSGFQQARCENCALRQTGLRLISGH